MLIFFYSRTIGTLCQLSWVSPRTKRTSSSIASTEPGKLLSRESSYLFQTYCGAHRSTSSRNCSLSPCDAAMVTVSSLLPRRIDRGLSHFQIGLGNPRISYTAWRGIVICGMRSTAKQTVVTNLNSRHTLTVTMKTTTLTWSWQSIVLVNQVRLLNFNELWFQFDVAIF